MPTVETVQTVQPTLPPEAIAYAGFQNIAGIQRSMIPYFIFSLFPVEREFEYLGVLVPLPNDPSRLGSQCRMYRMPNPEHRGKISWLRVDSIITHQRKLGEDLNDEATDAMWKHGEPEYMTVDARALAQAIKDSMFANILSHDGRVGSPGVFIISGEHVPPVFYEKNSGVASLADLRELRSLRLDAFPQFQAELQQAEQQQEVLANWLVSRCAGLANTNRANEISDLHRNVVAWGIGDMAARQFPWYGKQTPGLMKSCVACGSMIMKTALVCQHCNQNLVKFLKDLKDSGVDISKFNDPYALQILLTQAPAPTMNAGLVGASVVAGASIAGPSAVAGAGESTSAGTDTNPVTKPSFGDKLKNSTR